MISRKTAIILAEAYEVKFAWAQTAKGYAINDEDAVYDFLFEHEIPGWFCNIARTASKTSRGLREAIMRLHTGETQYQVTQNWKWDDRLKLGQDCLRQLAEAMLADGRESSNPYYRELIAKVTDLTRSLELDGFVFRNSRLLFSESDVLDVDRETGILENLYSKLALRDRETALHHLELSEEHYLAGKWDDSISNSRKFLECVLREVAVSHSLTARCKPLSESDLTRPVAVRDYLEEKGLLSEKEKEALAKVYGLLSETGSHPYIAENDQARLMRHLGLTFSQFVMLRLQGFSSQPP